MSKKTKKDYKVDVAQTFARKLTRFLCSNRVLEDNEAFRNFLHDQVRRLLYTAFPVDVEISARLVEQAVSAASAEMDLLIPPTEPTEPSEQAIAEKLNEHVTG